MIVAFSIVKMNLNQVLLLFESFLLSFNLELVSLFSLLFKSVLKLNFGLLPSLESLRFAFDCELIFERYNISVSIDISIGADGWGLNWIVQGLHHLWLLQVSFPLVDLSREMTFVGQKLALVMFYV